MQLSSQSKKLQHTRDDNSSSRWHVPRSSCHAYLVGLLNPLLSAETIRKAIHAYKLGVANGSNDSLFTVDRIQTRFYERDGTPVNHDPNNLVRTQDLNPWYEENSNLYIFSSASFMITNARISKNPYLYASPKYESIDIDEPEDWDFALAAISIQLQKSFMGGVRKSVS